MKKEPPCSEDKIRDHLANNLDLIENGLVLIKKEKYLPNDNGASGFIDIFARSKTGQLVIIEIKRSDAAARQAVQELAKYAALLKTKKLIKETEYRMLVISTDWNELITPFSEFIHATRYNCEGKKIIVGDNGLTSLIEDVTPLPPVETRKFSGRHFIWEFKDEQSARGSIHIIKNYMEDVGLKDFVIILIALKSPVVGISHFLYFAHQLKTLDQYMHLIRNRFSKEEVGEFEEWLSDFSEMEDKIEEAADKVWDTPSGQDGWHKLINAQFDCSGQISHPEKARYWFSEERSKNIEVARYGRFDDTNISDETIVNELKGDTGGSNSRLNISASMKSKPEIDALLTAADNIFFFNPDWKTAIHALCQYAERTASTSICLKAFNNDDIIAALSGIAIGYPYWLPAFNFEITQNGQNDLFVGIIEWNGQTADFDEIVTDHFDGDAFNYSLHRHLGSQRSINADLMETLGLSYSIARISNDQPEKIRIHGSSIKPIEKSKKKSFEDFLDENEALLGRIVNFHLEFDMGYNQLFANLINNQFFEAEQSLKEYLETPSKGKPLYWMGDLDECDLCKRPFETARFMIDGTTKMGAGACLCALCFKECGFKIGWGYGQLYNRTPKGWRLIAGGPPEGLNEPHEIE